MSDTEVGNECLLRGYRQPKESYNHAQDLQYSNLFTVFEVLTSQSVLQKSFFAFVCMFGGTFIYNCDVVFKKYIREIMDHCETLHDLGISSLWGKVLQFLHSREFLNSLKPINGRVR